MVFTEAVISGLSEGLTSSVMAASMRRIRKVFADPPRAQALERCAEAGILAMLRTIEAEDDAKLDPARELLARVFTGAEHGPDAGKAVAPLLRGERLDREGLGELFEDAGFEPAKLPAFDLDRALRAFEAGFVTAAAEHPDLQGEIRTHLVQSQLALQRETLAELQRLAEWLRDAKPGSALIEAGSIKATHVTGQQIIFEGPAIQVVVGASAGPWQEHYLRTLIQDCDPLDLTAIDETHPQGARPGDGERVRLSDVFTSLHLAGVARFPGQSVEEAILGRGEKLEAASRGKQEGEPSPIAALEAAGALPRVVVLGRPGGGKSTLVNHLATQLAKRRLGEEVGEEKLPGWPGDARPLPVRIVLRRFASWLPAKPGPELRGRVWEYLEHQLMQCGCGDAFDGLKRTLVEAGGIVFFDGLDEVQESDAERKRTLIRKCIEQFAAPLEHCRVVVTCREYAYTKGDAWRLADFREVTLAPFGMQQVEAFTAAWYRTLGPSKGWDVERCGREAANLSQAIGTYPHLSSLAKSPLLLTLMTQIHGRDGYLPRDRADLYERAVNLLLAHWENRLIRELEEGTTVEKERVLRLDLPIDRLRSALQKVAYEAHHRQGREGSKSEGAADIAGQDLLEALDAELGSLDRAREVVTYVQQRAGLLVAEDGGTYRFPHRTFQEYLAARYLLDQANCDELLRELVQEDLGWWREVYLLAAGALRRTPKLVVDLVDELLPQEPKGRAETSRYEEACLASQALVEAGLVERLQEGDSKPGRIDASVERLVAWTRSGMTAPDVVAPTRASCGSWLSHLGDPRESVRTLDGMEFCWVPGGPFWMGEDRYEREKPQHRNEHLSYDYWLARYPVTVAQFRDYVKQSGREPGDRDALRGSGNAPVVEVSWEEAMGFCAWLTEDWREKGLLPEGLGVRLPSEAEWEKGARGGLEVPREAVVVGMREVQDRASGGRGALVKNAASKRGFPWGDDFDKDRCNSAESGIGRVSAVGCFRGECSPYGCEELSGNVWEWTRSAWEIGEREFNYPYDPSDGREATDREIAKSLWVLRGGAFDHAGNVVRCSARLGHHPRGRNCYIGFRVALSPI